ncbi:hypothetical protein U8326_10140 [Tsuneonella sp. CC-YZS046]|uniref:hypothetical protein n=1 Tax=Tsuneonella sp. CC-YZS046 TaxID=3042152 RepID=UPI002D798734|nr:hypothetical protein [Tsuneonella sp. CC-YZS046]WRO65420.1 hypothetical protein U8326_10140 [Tsuneonella sp. CC-YZS046]
MDDSNLTAALQANPSEWDLVGPTAEADIRRAIARYGDAAVKAAVKNLTKPKRGRKQERDWPELREYIEKDAREWLAGGDPFKTRTNYSIAQDFAAKNPGHGAVSTHKRIERKLAKKPYDRRWFVLVTAMHLSRDSLPHAQHIRALEELAQLNASAGIWQEALELAQSDIADYQAKTGGPPQASLSMKEIQSGARNALLAAVRPLNRQGGLFGFLPPLSALSGQAE